MPRSASPFIRSVSRRRFLAGGAVTAVGSAALIAGCGGGNSKGAASPSGISPAASPSEAASTPQKGGTLRLPTIFASGGNFDVQKFVPAQYTAAVWRTCGNGLFTIDPKTGNPIPDLVDTWSFPDPLTFVAKLKPGAKWHNKPPVNGRAVTAADVKFSLERIATNDPAFVRHSDYDLVDRFEAPDDQTVRIVLKQPFVPLVSALANQQAVIVAPEVIQKFGDLSSADAIIGSGPFILDHADTTQGGAVKRNPDYWEKGGPYLDGIQWTIVNDPQTILSGFQSGKFDMYQVATIDLPSVKGLSGVTVAHYLAPNNFLQGLGGPIDKAPLNDIRVRQAINLAIDRKGLGNVVYPGGDFQPAAVIANPAWGIPSDALLTRPGFRQPKDADLADAKKLVAAAGGNIELTITTTSSFPSFYLDRAQAYKAQLEAVGFKVTLDTSDYTSFKSKETNKRFQVDTLSPAFATDPDSLLSGAFSSSGARNYFSYSSKEFDDYIAKERAESDPEKRKQIILEAQELLLKDLPVAGFANWYVYSDLAIRDNVKGVQLGGIGPSGAQAGDQSFQAKNIWMTS
ncbi:hypothetical protein J0H33_15085 [bacterium]|jgi:peptide/nickel transport system substrate-binding protein|nr:hypothetical protein [bacterium]